MQGGTRDGTLTSVAAALALIALSPGLLRAEHLPIRTYNASHGLAHDRVRCVLADSRGFLWFCTADGLSRFDGAHFVNYGVEQGLPHPEVNAIVEAGPGVYWVATERGLARLSALADSSSSAGAREAPPLTSHALGSGGTATDVYRLTVDRQGRLWIGSAAGLFLVDDPLGEPRFRRVDPDPPQQPFGSVEGLAASEDGTLWIGSSSGLFRRLPNGRVVRDDIFKSTEEMGRLAVDRAGRLWASSGNGLSVGLAAVPGSASNAPRAPGSLRACQNSRGLQLPTSPGDACGFETIAGRKASIRSLSAGPGGQVWIGTPGGLIEFDGREFRVYSEQQGLPNESVNAAVEDKAGDLWIGTDTGGVARLARHGFVGFKETDGLRQGYVTSISQSRAGRVRAGGGWPLLNEFDGHRFAHHSFAFPGRMEDARVYGVFEDHTGDLWVGSPDSELFRFPEAPSVAQLARTKPKARYSLADNLPGFRITPSFEDSRGDLWMTAYSGTEFRIVRWQRSTGRFDQHPEADSPLVSLRGPAFAEDGAGTVWLGSGRGLSRQRGERFMNVAVGGANATLSVTALHVDARGRLWVGTRGAGLYRSDDPTAERPHFAAYALADGSSSATIWCLTSDLEGHLYAGTTRGVDRLDPESGRLRRFSVADGLVGSEVIAAFRDREGALWFGSLNGISRLTSRPAVDRQPTVWVGGIRIRGVAQALNALGQAHVALGELASDQNDIQIDYFGLSPAATDLLTYQHQLEAQGSTWSPQTADRTVIFAELAPGSYRFVVRATSGSGQVSPSPASVTFTIRPPWWKRGSFLGVLILLAAASGYGVHRYRVRRLLEMARLRTRIATDLHDDVGSSLTQISMLSEIARMQIAGQNVPVDGPLARIGVLSRESVDSMSDIVWAIDPVRDTPEHLLQRMRRVAHELVEGAGMELRFESSGDSSPHLGVDVRHHVFLMFKEALHNVVRHAGATRVSIEVRIAARELHVAIEDDGCGFDVATASEGQGLRSLERRAASLGGVLRLRSSPGTGTHVAFSVPAR
jgi:ligand-binding sensor domain-containing protein/signal transduction histidine kinase